MSESQPKTAYPLNGPRPWAWVNQNGRIDFGQMLDQGDDWRPLYDAHELVRVINAETERARAEATEPVRQIVREWSELDSDPAHYALYRRLADLVGML